MKYSAKNVTVVSTMQTLSSSIYATTLHMIPIAKIATVLSTATTPTNSTCVIRRDTKPGLKSTKNKEGFPILYNHTA